MFSRRNISSVMDLIKEQQNNDTASEVIESFETNNSIDESNGDEDIDRISNELALKTQRGGDKMLKYKFNVGDALERAGFNTYKAKTTGLISQDALRKIKSEDTSINLTTLNNLCLILDLQPKDIFIYEETAEEHEKKLKVFSKN